MKCSNINNANVSPIRLWWCAQMKVFDYNGQVPNYEPHFDFPTLFANIVLIISLLTVA